MRLRLFAAATATALLATPALADREATEVEALPITRILQASGFTGWDRISWDDDGWWEVDDARREDGTEWDLRMEAETLNIVRSRRDD